MDASRASTPSASVPPTSRSPPPPPRVAHTGRPASGGPDWLLIAIGSTAVLALLLAVAVLPTRWLRAHPFRARQV